MSRTIRKHINYETGKEEKIRDNKPRCQCCCNPRHSSHGNKKEKLTIQERRAFTLVELLVVMCIISILTAMLTTSAARAKEAGQKGACIANERNIKSLNLIGVPVVYAQDYEYPYWSPYEGKEGYVEIQFPYGGKETVLFVNCFDCHDKNDPFNPLYEIITVY